jgi:ketosteroid isomerase-like protein
VSRAAEHDLASVARGAVEIVCTGRLDRVAEFYDETCVDHVNGMVFRGHAGAVESVGFYRALFGDFRIDIDDELLDGDRVALRWTLRGSYRARPVSLGGIVISRFRDGRIVEDHSYTDPLALVRALGVRGVAQLALDLLLRRVRLPRGALGGRR